MTYDQAIEKLNSIISEIEQNDALSMDVFVEKAKEAKRLIVFCQNQLVDLDKTIENILEEKAE